MANHGKKYSNVEKWFIALVAHLYVQSRNHMETVVAPQVAQLLGRSDCAICKQMELALGIHYRKDF